MIFHQFFDDISFTYTYLVSSGEGREALIIDPVIEKTDEYISLLKKLNLKLVKVIDTHIHADHFSGLKELNNITGCVTVMGQRAKADVVSLHVKDNEKIKIEDIELTTIYTPGHTDDSYSFFMKDRVFTGDTLLIKGTGRTDFQNGNPHEQYHSIFKRLLTIGEEKNFNPRLQVSSEEQYVEIMNNLKLDSPKMMDVAVPANKRGITLKEIENRNN